MKKPTSEFYFACGLISITEQENDIAQYYTTQKHQFQSPILNLQTIRVRSVAGAFPLARIPVQDTLNAKWITGEPDSLIMPRFGRYLSSDRTSPRD